MDKPDIDQASQQASMPDSDGIGPDVYQGDRHGAVGDAVVAETVTVDSATVTDAVNVPGSVEGVAVQDAKAGPMSCADGVDSAQAGPMSCADGVESVQIQDAVIRLGQSGGEQAINEPISNGQQPAKRMSQAQIANQFKPGNVANPRGRPPGSKNKLGQAFVNDLYSHWQDNGLQAIEKVYQDKPDVYLKVVAQIIPRDINVNHEVGEMTREQIIERIKQLDRQLGPILDMAANEPDQ